MARALLEPVAAGQTRFRMQGLSPDARGIAVGREALVVLESLDRLVAFLGAYSEEASLDDLLPSLTIERAAREGGGQALLLRCQAGDGYSLDRLSRLAGAARGQLFAGGGSVFVRYRERSAPFGYDLAVPVTELGGVTAEQVMVVDLELASTYHTRDMIEPVGLIQRLALRPVPLPLDGLASDPDLGGLRDLALVLIAPGISDRVLSYLWHHRVSMAGVRVTLSEERQSSLLLRLRQPSVRILDILRAIPGVELLVPVSPRAAVELGYRHPIHLASASACFPGDEMYLFRGRSDSVERIDGAPRFVDGQHLVAAEVELRDSEPGGVELRELAPLRVDLRLRPTTQAREPRASLIAWEELELLRRLVYVIPPSSLAAARVVPLELGLLVLSGASRSSSRAVAAGTIVPLGRRMVEAAPGVLVPDGFELWPRIRPDLVRELLNLEGDDHAIFLGNETPPFLLRADDMLSLDAAVLGSLDPSPAAVVEPTLAPLEPGEIENQRLGRFALWGFRGAGDEA